MNYTIRIASAAIITGAALVSAFGLGTMGSASARGGDSDAALAPIRTIAIDEPRFDKRNVELPKQSAPLQRESLRDGAGSSHAPTPTPPPPSNIDLSSVPELQERGSDDTPPPSERPVIRAETPKPPPTPVPPVREQVGRGADVSPSSTAGRHIDILVELGVVDETGAPVGSAPSPRQFLSLLGVPLSPWGDLTDLKPRDGAATADAPAPDDLVHADDGSSTQKKGPVTAFGKCQVPGKCTVGLKFTIWRF